MTFLEIDWRRFLECAAIWSGLSPKFRQAFLELKSQKHAYVSRFGGDLVTRQSHGAAKPKRRVNAI